MPNKTKTATSSYRFTTEELATMDRLGIALAPRGLPPLTRTDVLRMALDRLREATEQPPAKKKT